MPSGWASYLLVLLYVSSPSAVGSQFRTRKPDVGWVFDQTKGTMVTMNSFINPALLVYPVSQLLSPNPIAHDLSALIGKLRMFAKDSGGLFYTSQASLSKILSLLISKMQHLASKLAL